MIAGILIETVLGLVLLAIGRWGRANEGRLASGWMDPDDRAGRERMYRRGALTCTVLGVIFLLVALADSLQRLI